MSRRLSGEATPEEVDELHSLLEQSPNKQYLYSILHSWFSDAPSASTTSLPPEDPDFEDRFQRIIGVESESPAEGIIRPIRRRRLLYLTSVAASVIALCLLSWSLYKSHSAVRRPAEPPHREEVLAKAGTRTRLVLPDGSQVWLNSSSKLRYTNDFNKRSREVALEGEAYFNVTRDASRPFIVHTSSLDVKVLGTAFTIKSYPQDPTAETTLLNGSVEVTRKDNPNAARVILKPNEKLVFNRMVSPIETIAQNKPGIRVSPPPDIAVNSIPINIPDSNKVETAWMYNRLVFHGDNFRELTEKMERWYNVKITIRDSSLYTCRFGGTFANETIDEAFKALQLTSAKAFTYRIDGNEIELYAKY
ncbi:MAG: FecR domain-containing protein [Bacteroidetes bacterium]|nr:FecR domain-containing protein [Bacteroidota bacterium]